MGLWGPSAISCSSRSNALYFQRAAYWLGWFNRHCHPIERGHSGRCYPGCDTSTVGPAYRVEIRSVEVADRQPCDLGSTRGSKIIEGRALRPWPFRWPVSEADAIAPELPAEPTRATGNYIDILV